MTGEARLEIYRMGLLSPNDDRIHRLVVGHVYLN